MTEQPDDNVYPLRPELPAGEQEPPTVNSELRVRGDERPLFPTRAQLKASVTYRSKTAATATVRGVLGAPRAAAGTVGPAIRGLGILLGAWRAWVALDELHAAIEHSPKEQHARAHRDLVNRQNKRWKMTFLAALVLTVAGGVVWRTVPDTTYRHLVWAAPLLLLIGVCEIVGRRPTRTPDPAAEPPGPLQPGIPIKVLQASIVDILLERCDTHVVVPELRPRPDGCGWEGRLVFPGARADDDKLIAALEEGLMTPARAIALMEDPRNRAQELITINLTNPLANPPTAPDHEPRTLSVRQAVPLGVPDLAVVFCRTNVLLIGKTRSGKTGGIRVTVDALTGMADCVVAGIDLSDGPGLSRFDGCLQPYATTHDQAHALLEEAVGFVERRTAALKAAVKADPQHPDDHQPTETDPQLTIVIDEFSRLARHQCCVEMVKEISVRGAKAAVNWVIGSQTGTKDDLGNPAIKDSAAVLIFLACAKNMVPLFLGEKMLSAGWRPDRLEPAQGDEPRDAGTCFVSGAGHTLPVPQRFFTLPSAEVSRRAAKREPHVARLRDTVDAVEVPEVLAALAAAFRTTGADRLSTAALLEHLGPGWTAERLADELRPHGISPANLKFGRGVTLKGYRRGAVDDAIRAL